MKKLLQHWEPRFSERITPEMNERSGLEKLTEAEVEAINDAVLFGDEERLNEVADSICSGMLGISMRQPWAMAVVKGLKIVENRR